MKFKSKAANKIVWDRQKGKALCTFVNHECETDDQYIIDKLTDKYEVTDHGRKAEQENTEGQTFEPEQIEQLRQEAKEKSIKNWHNMKPENLIEKLKEGADNE